MKISMKMNLIKVRILMNTLLKFILTAILKQSIKTPQSIKNR